MHLNLPILLDLELQKPKDNVWLLINLHNQHQQERMFFCWEVHETEKLKDILVCIQVKRVPTLLQESGQKEENGKEQEEEDEIVFKFKL